MACLDGWVPNADKSACTRCAGGTYDKDGTHATCSACAQGSGAPAYKSMAVGGAVQVGKRCKEFSTGKSATYPVRAKTTAGGLEPQKLLSVHECATPCNANAAWCWGIPAHKTEGPSSQNI